MTPCGRLGLFPDFLAFLLGLKIQLGSRSDSEEKRKRSTQSQVCIQEETSWEEAAGPPALELQP